MKIYMIRHTAVDIPQGMCYGQTDVSLKDTFEIEAGTVKGNLKEIEFEMVFSSPLSRCTKLANYCGFSDAILDNRLKELYFGDWEGQQWDEIDMDIWKTDWVNHPTPNGESFIHLYERVASFLNELKEKTYDTALIFTHGGVISCARVYFQQADISRTFELIPNYGEIVEFDL